MCDGWKVIGGGSGCVRLVNGFGWVGGVCVVVCGGGGYGGKWRVGVWCDWMVGGGVNERWVGKWWWWLRA